MNTINLDLQLFDRFITESENHLNMIRDHYSNLSKGYLTESTEYQLIQESSDSSFKEKIKKIIEAIMKWIRGIVEKIKQKFRGNKQKTDAAINKLKNSNSTSDNNTGFTHSKFDLSKFDNIKIVNIVSIFIEKVTNIIESSKPDSIDHKVINELSSNCDKDMMQSIGGGHNFYTNKSSVVKLFIDMETKVTKSYTKDEILTLLEKTKKLYDPLNDINENLEIMYKKFLSIINKKIDSNPVTNDTSIYQYILTQTNHTMSVAYKIIDDILDAYVLCDNQIFSISTRMDIKDNAKHESFSPPIDASFESLLESINPTKIKILDLN